MAAAALLCACSASQIDTPLDTPRPIPTHITFDVAEGTWGVACEGTGLADQYPKAVAVLSTWQGETREGVWFVPGTKGYEKAAVTLKRNPGHRATDTVQVVAVPKFVEPSGEGWRVVVGDMRVGGTDHEFIEKGSYMMRVPVRPTRGLRHGEEPFIECLIRTL